MQWKRYLLSLMVFLFVGAGISAAAAKLVDRIVAYVNDDIITLSELNERTGEFITARRQNPFLPEHGQSIEDIRRDILDSMINDRLAAQEISRLKISVSQAEVNEMVSRILLENHISREVLQAQLRKEGKTIEDLRRRIRQDLERTKLIDREVRQKTVITPEQVQAYYQQHLQEFQGKVRRRLQDIFLPFPPGTDAEGRARIQALAERILERLRQGADFALMARRYSQGPGAEEGGDLGFFSKGELDPVLEKAVESLEPGEVTGAVPTTRGLHIIKLLKVDRTPPKSLQEVGDLIRRRLYQQEINRKYREWLQNLRKRSYVKVVY